MRKRMSEAGARVQLWARSVLDGLASLYIAAILAVQPLYFTQGFGRIGTDKAMFLRYTSLGLGGAAALLLALWALGGLVQGGDRQVRQREGRIGGASGHPIGPLGRDWTGLGLMAPAAAAVFALAVGISLWTSEFGLRGFWGKEGWYMGAFAQWGLLVGMVLLACFWKPRPWPWLAMAGTSLVVAGLGILDRFGIYCLDMEWRKPDFISTVGNINWYCAYLGLACGLGLYALWLPGGWSALLGRRGRFWKGFGWIYSALLLVSLFTQGSSSALLAYGGMNLVLFLLSLDGRLDEGLAGLGRIWALTAAVLAGLWMLIWAFPQALTYREQILLALCRPGPGAVFVLLSAGAFALGRRRYAPRDGHLGLKLLALTGILALGVWALALTSFGRYGFSPAPWWEPLGFGLDWGSKRGMTWLAGAHIFWQGDWGKRLWGVGPDCMGFWLYERGGSELQALLQAHFGQAVLSNAHNEWLSILVNLGLAGLLAHGLLWGVLTAGLWRGSLAGRHGCGIALLSMAAYQWNNAVSFQQSLNAATVCVLMGMGWAWLRGDRGLGECKGLKKLENNRKNS